MTIGKNVAAAMEKSAATSPDVRDVILKHADEARDWTAIYELVVGDTSGKIYEARIELSDDVSPSTQIIVVHYEETTVVAPSIR